MNPVRRANAISLGLGLATGADAAADSLGDSDGSPVLGDGAMVGAFVAPEPLAQAAKLSLAAAMAMGAAACHERSGVRGCPCMDARHVPILGALAAFAITGLVFLVTQARNVPEPRTTGHLERR